MSEVVITTLCHVYPTHLTQLQCNAGGHECRPRLLRCVQEAKHAYDAAICIFILHTFTTATMGGKGEVELITQ